MKRTSIIQTAMAMALLLVTAVSGRSQSIFFNDVFTNSFLTNTTVTGYPKTNGADYTVISSKNWVPAPSLTTNGLLFGIASTTSGSIEAQALFTTNPVALVQPGDYVQLVVVFTNNTGILSASSSLGFGLYNAGQTNPILTGLQGSATSGNTQAGGANQWAGYVGQVTFNGGNHRIMTRAAQTGTTANDQDLLTSGSGSSSYNNPGASTVGSTVASTVIMTNGYVYTEVLNITLLAAGSEAITNVLYSGPNTNSPVMATFGGISTNGTFLASSFDGLAIGWRAGAATTGGTIIDIASVQVNGQVSTITGPPLITTQPVPAAAATNGYAEFSVAAVGFNVAYQWYRNGTALANGGDISGVTATTLVVSPCQNADSFSTANGYYCKVSGAGGFSTNSVTNSLTLYPVTNLTWTAAAGPTWDINNTVSFEDSNSVPMVFIGGDAVNFIDSASVNNTISLTGDLAPASMYVNTATAFTFQGSGSIVGPGNVTLTGAGTPSSGTVTLNVNNTYSGGTTISNGVYLSLKNYGGFGTGPVNLNDESGTMEFFNSGSATVGIIGPVNVNADYSIQLDVGGTFSGVFLNDLNGTSGVALTFNDGSGVQTNRIRLYGTNSVCNSGIVLNGPSFPNLALYYGMQMAPYNAVGAQTFNGVISGNGGIVQRGNGQSIYTGQNTYSGGTFTTAGNIGIGADSAGGLVSGPIGTGGLVVAPEVGSGNGTGGIFAAGGAHTIANPIVYPSNTNNQTLQIGGANALTLTANFSLNGADGSAGPITRTFQVTNSAVTTFSGVISDGGQADGLNKTGSGRLDLNGANTYTGNTTNTAGLLAGSGSIAGSVIVTTNASIGGGTFASPGTFTIGGNLTLTNGNGFFRINRSGTTDQISVGGTLAASGVSSVIVTNVGTTLQAGDTFHLFNKAVTGSALSIVGGNVNWVNNLANDGSIQVLSSIANYPTNLTVAYNGTNIGISWPSTHLGWILQSQTNNFNVGLRTNWVDMPNTASVLSTNLVVTITNKTVFFRLRSPN